MTLKKVFEKNAFAPLHFRNLLETINSQDWKQRTCVCTTCYGLRTSMYLSVERTARNLDLGTAHDAPLQFEFNGQQFREHHKPKTYARTIIVSCSGKVRRLTTFSFPLKANEPHLPLPNRNLSFQPNLSCTCHNALPPLPTVRVLVTANRRPQNNNGHEGKTKRTPL